MTSNFRLSSTIALFAAALLGTGCSTDAVTSPRSASVPSPAASKGPPPVKGHGDPDSKKQGILRTSPLKDDITVKQTIDSTGGTITIPAAGLTLIFEPGAVARSTDITVTALKGQNVAYEFQPHGIVFNAPVRVKQDMGMTNFATAYDSATVIHGGYLPDGALDINPDGSAYETSTFDAWTDFWVDANNVVHLKNSVFVIPHFSGYILTGGRQ